MKLINKEQKQESLCVYVNKKKKPKYLQKAEE
jgi:hypothetical protein